MYKRDKSKHKRIECDLFHSPSICLSVSHDVFLYVAVCVYYVRLYYGMCAYSRALDSSCKNMLKCNLTKVMLNKLAATAKSFALYDGMHFHIDIDLILTLTTSPAKVVAVAIRPSPLYWISFCNALHFAMQRWYLHHKTIKSSMEKND